MERLCRDLNVPAEDVSSTQKRSNLKTLKNNSRINRLIVTLKIALLVLAWKLNAKRMGYFTREEFIAGMTEMQ